MALALRTQRTEARLLPEQKKRIEQAASLKGLSVSDFIVQHADEAAIKTLPKAPNIIFMAGRKFGAEGVKRYKERGGE